MFRSTASKQRARERGKALARQWIDDVHAHGVERMQERERRERWMTKLSAAAQEWARGIARVKLGPTDES